MSFNIVFCFIRKDFGSGSNTPVASFTSSFFVSNISFSILLISWRNSSGTYLISSTLILFISWWFVVGRFLHCFCHFFNCFHLIQWTYDFSIGFVLSFLKRFLKCLSEFLVVIICIFPVRHAQTELFGFYCGEILLF